MKRFIIPEMKITKFNSERVSTDADPGVYVSAVGAAEAELRQKYIDQQWIKTGDIIKFSM